MNTPNFENLTIPSEILFNKDLTDREKMLLSIILSLSRKSNFCYAGNEYISDIFNVSAGTISRDISSLRNKKYIDEILNDKAKNSKKRKIIPIKENIFKYSQNGQGGVDESNYECPQNCQEGIVKNDKYINNNYINSNKYNGYNGKQFQGCKPYRDSQYENMDLSPYYANF